MYGISGVCRVAKIGKPQFASGDHKKLYYTLVPEYGTETIYAPVDTTVFMRPILTKKEAEELVSKIPDIPKGDCSGRSISVIKERYESALKAHRCEDLVGMIKSIYAKSREAARCGRKIGQVDQRYMKRAEDLLYGELAVSLGIDREEVVPYMEKAAGVAGE